MVLSLLPADLKGHRPLVLLLVLEELLQCTFSGMSNDNAEITFSFRVLHTLIMMVQGVTVRLFQGLVNLVPPVT